MRLRIRRLPEVFPLLFSYRGRERVRAELNLRAWPLVAPIAERWRRTILRRTPVIAVVGSQGKSTTVRAIGAALGFDPATWVDANCGAEIAAGLLRGRPWHKAVVLEIGIGARGQMQSYAERVRPSSVVVTSVGTEHGGSLGTREQIRDEKAHILDGLSPQGTLFLNADDEHVTWMGRRTRAECVTYGFGSDADVRGSDLVLRWPDGIDFTVRVGGESRRAHTRFVSKDLVRSLLAAVAVAVRLGERLDIVLGRIEDLRPTPRRLEPQRLPNGAWLLRDEYKSSLETVDSALDVLEAIDVPGRRFVVLGEISEPPGSQGPIYRRIGERVGNISDAAVFVGGNFQRYAAGARRANMPSDRLIDAGRSWRAAAEFARKKLQAGDVLLVKGRDTQRLDRVSLALLGRGVSCELTECDLLGCDGCPMLGRGR